MAVVEEGSDGSRSPSRPKYEPLSKWDKGEGAPRAPVGANYRPPVPVPNPSFGTPRLKKLTPYAIPTQAERTVGTEAAAQPFAPTTGYGGIGQPDSEKPVSSTTSRLEALQQMPGSEGRTETIEREGKERTKRVLKLSWDDYRKLSDEKRAAVDFNTLLVQAREKDLNADYDATPAQMERFQAEAEKMFGEGRGSETFAPETLGVLKDIDFKSSGTEDLDNFLGLKDAISAKELKGFTFDREVRPPEVENPQRDAVLKAISPGGAGGLATDQRAAVYTQNVQAAVARAGEVLQTWRATAARRRNDEVLGLGGDVNEVSMARGYGQKPMFEDADADGRPDNYPFRSLAQDTLAAIANPKFDLKIAYDAIGKLGRKDRQDIMRYFDEQTRAAAESGTGVLGIEGEGTRNPVEIRKLLGLDGDR